MNTLKQCKLLHFVTFVKGLAFFVALSIIVVSCKTFNDSVAKPGTQVSEQGKYTRKAISKMNGFANVKKELLKSNGMKKKEFIAFSTDSAWALSAGDRERLRKFREGLAWPDSTVLLQKVIPMKDLPDYENNVKGGVVGGFIAVAADVKSLKSLEDVYNGLRLDYSGTAFSLEDEGYAVIRFYSSHTDSLYIPFGPELGGPQEHAWPNTGGGFTSSSLGKGGFPEWVFTTKYLPKEGAEIYWVDADGKKETLSSVFENGKWRKVNKEK